MTWLLCILTSKRMLAHGQNWWKTFENHEKYLFHHVYKRLMKGSWKKHNQKQQNSKWATSFWVSTSFWESLPIAAQQTFFFGFLHKPYMSHAWWKRYFFHDFQMFFIFSTMRTHAQARLKYATHSCHFKKEMSGRLFQVMQFSYVNGATLLDILSHSWL